MGWTIRHATLASATALTLLGVHESVIAAQPPAPQEQTLHKFDLNIPTQPLSSALSSLARQTGEPILADSKVTKGRRSDGVSGSYTVPDALTEILKSTGLKYQYRDDRSYLVTAQLAEAMGVTRRGISANDANGDQRSIRVAQISEQDEEKASVEEEEEKRRDVVIVTGSRIVGVKDQFSPVTQISREEMDLAGFNNVSDIFDTLPQNFGGGAAIDTSLADSPDGPGGAGVNLRGLGNQATLILLNGRRFAAGGSTGNFVDISSIPASAIERVETLTDGASAIYGADAIAGVVNIILRDDFEGAETRLNVGTITDGGGDYLKVGQTLGWSGDRAHAMVTYEYSDEEELDANQREFAENAPDPSWLLPFTQKHSVLASASAQVSDRFTFSADGYFNDRKSKHFTSIDVPSAFIQAFQETNVQQYGGALGLEVQLGKEWDTKVSGSYSRSDFSSDNVRLNSVGGDDWEAVTEILSVNGSVGGPVLNISDDPVRVVIGGQFRSEKADLFATRIPSGAVRIDSDKSRNVVAGFGEIYAPIVSEGNSMPGFESLAITAATRFEDYSDVGSSLVPKVGLSWSPIAGINLRGTYGKSFRAPRLDQLVDRIEFVALNLYVDPIAPDGESVALLVRGTKADLDPETSRTWTVGFDFTPESLDGLLLRGTYFNTVFDDQVGVASAPPFDSSLRYTDFTGVITRDVGPGTAEDLCARAVEEGTGCFNLSDFFPSLGDLFIEDVEILLDSRFQNLSLSRVAGFDFEGHYDFSSAIGDWRLSLAGTLLTTFEQQVAPALPIDDLLNTFGNPIDLKLRGGVQWRSESITTAVFVNHVGDYIDDQLPTGNTPINSFTTLDATIRLNLDEIGDSALTEGATLSFSILNMLNEAPPFISAMPTRFATFDAANANPAGRKVGLLLTKRW